jgi:hypothetical protein
MSSTRRVGSPSTIRGGQGHPSSEGRAFFAKVIGRFLSKELMDKYWKAGGKFIRLRDADYLALGYPPIQ